MNKKKLAVPFAALALMLSAGGGMVAAAHAADDTAATTTTSAATTDQSGSDQGTRQKPAAMGTVTAISGNTITLTDKQSSTTYTIDASSATIQKHIRPTASASSSTATPTAPVAPTTISVSDIVVGDMLMVQGTVSGSTITATKIDDGELGGHGDFGGGHGRGVHGTVTAVNGTTLTVQNSDGTSYTVDAASATASKVTTMSVSDVAVGDSIDVDGTVSGSSITATHLMEGMPQMQQPTTTTSS